MKKERFQILLPSPELQAPILRDFHACIDFANSSAASSVLPSIAPDADQQAPSCSATRHPATVRSRSAAAHVARTLYRPQLARIQHRILDRPLAATGLSPRTLPKAAPRTAAGRLAGAVADQHVLQPELWRSAEHQSADGPDVDPVTPVVKQPSAAAASAAAQWAALQRQPNALAASVWAAQRRPACPSSAA